MIEKPSSASSGKTVWLLNRNFTLLWSGQLISIIGDYLFYTTIELWIAQKIALGQTWAPLAVSGSLIALIVPSVLLGPIAGVFVDRWEKRSTMVRMDVLRAFFIALLVLVAMPWSAYLPLAFKLSLIYVVMVLVAICTQFFSPARLGLINTVVTAEQRTQASSLLFMNTSLGIVIGPALCAPLFFAVGPAWALVGNVFSFLISFLALRAISLSALPAFPTDDRQSTLWQDFLVGVHYYKGNCILRTLLVVTALTLIGSSAINTLGIFFLTTNLHRSAQWYGLLNAATGIGVLLGSFAAAWLVPKMGAACAFWSMTMLTGVLLLLYAWQTEYSFALVLLILIGLPSAALNVAIGPLLLQATPPEMVGRIFALFAPATAGAALLATALAGALASTILYNFHVRVGSIVFGPYNTIYCLGAAIIILSGVYAWTQLRDANSQMRTTDAEKTQKNRNKHCFLSSRRKKAL